MARILVIDDNPAIITALEVLFEAHGIDTTGAPDPRTGLERLAEGGVDLVVQDMNFSPDAISGAEGTALFEQVRKRWPELPIILLTAWSDVKTAVEVVKAGAADYVAKPWDDDRLITTVRNLLDLRDLRREREAERRLRRRTLERLRREYDLRGMIFESREMAERVTLTVRVARADVPVLLTGPSGAGKGKLAEILQANSSRRSGPFVQVNAGALPSELIEAELFGAEAGAYTGANKARAGRFEAASGGTLFLDEIGNLSAAGQMKLLRVLETGQFERLGSNETRFADVRVVSATNADLKRLIAEGRFREDLYYRLNVIEIDVPPLAERRADVLPLAEAFLGSDHGYSAAARALLEAYPWPGNVRELHNVVQRARLVAGGPVIQPADLGLQLPPDRDNDPERQRAAIERAMGEVGGNVSQAAKALGMSRQALYRRMQKLGIAAGGD
jgi:DNA-binding NtrC family response regulator